VTHLKVVVQAVRKKN